ncbi:MAG: transposase [Clostridia bacterium]
MAKRVIKYLGRYTHRVAISNQRIEKEEKVTFKYKDRKDNNKEKEMTLEVEKFIRRFLMHILPPYFMKIRHYGLLGNRNKKTKLAICKKLTNTANIQHQELSTLEILKKTLGVDFNLCPFCKTGHLINPNSG